MAHGEARPVTLGSILAHAATGDDGTDALASAAVIVGGCVAHLPRRDRLSLAYSCRTLAELVLPYVYERPEFTSRTRTPIYAFQKFLKIAANCRQFFSSVAVLDLEGIHETLFDSVPENWLLCLFRACGGLKELSLRKATFLSDASVRSLSQYPPHAMLRKLDITRTDGLSSIGLSRLVEKLPQLEQLIANRCRGLNDASLLAIAQAARRLTLLSIEDAPITDPGLAAAVSASEWPRTLKALHLKGLVRITDQGAGASLQPFRHGPLEELRLRDCLKMTSSIPLALTLPVAAGGGIGCRLTALDLLGCPNAVLQPVSELLLPLARAVGATLRSLALPFSALRHADMKIDLYEPFASHPGGFGRVLRSLTLSDVRETDPSNVFARLAGDWARGLRECRLVRASYTRDWIVTDFYSSVGESFFVTDAAFVGRFNAEYGHRCKMQLLTVEEFDVAEGWDMLST